MKLFSKFIVRSGAKVLLLEPFCFVWIEFRPGFGYTLKTEGFSEFIQREDLLCCTGIPPKKCQHVNKGSGEISFFSVT